MSIQKNIFYIIILLSSLIIFSCSEDKPSDSTQIEDTTTNIQATAPAGLTPANTAPAPGEVAHFICPNNCAGSGGALQANCPVCATAYVHNKAYHDQPGQAQKQPELVPMTAPGAQNITGDIDVIQQSQQQPKQAAPAQNANGVWHFKCDAGCEGGAAAAGPCGACGLALKHNKAYHN